MTACGLNRSSIASRGASPSVCRRRVLADALVAGGGLRQQPEREVPDRPAVAERLHQLPVPHRPPGRRPRGQRRQVADAGGVDGPVGAGRPALPRRGGRVEPLLLLAVEGELRRGEQPYVLLSQVQTPHHLRLRHVLPRRARGETAREFALPGGHGDVHVEAQGRPEGAGRLGAVGEDVRTGGGPALVAARAAAVPLVAGRGGQDARDHPGLAEDQPADRPRTAAPALQVAGDTGVAAHQPLLGVAQVAGLAERALDAQLYVVGVHRGLAAQPHPDAGRQQLVLVDAEVGLRQGDHQLAVVAPLCLGLLVVGVRRRCGGAEGGQIAGQPGVGREHLLHGLHHGPGVELAQSDAGSHAAEGEMTLYVLLRLAGGSRVPGGVLLGPLDLPLRLLRLLDELPGTHARRQRQPEGLRLVGPQADPHLHLVPGDPLAGVQDLLPGAGSRALHGELHRPQVEHLVAADLRALPTGHGLLGHREARLAGRRDGHRRGPYDSRVAGRADADRRARTARDGPPLARGVGHRVLGLLVRAQLGLPGAPGGGEAGDRGPDAVTARGVAVLGLQILADDTVAQQPGHVLQDGRRGRRLVQPGAAGRARGDQRGVQNGGDRVEETAAALVRSCGVGHTQRGHGVGERDPPGGLPGDRPGRGRGAGAGRDEVLGRHPLGEGAGAVEALLVRGAVLLDPDAVAHLARHLDRALVAAQHARFGHVLLAARLPRGLPGLHVAGGRAAHPQPRRDRREPEGQTARALARRTAGRGAHGGGRVVLDVDLGVRALGLVQFGERCPVRVRRGRGEGGPGVEDGGPVVVGGGDGDGDVEPLLALGALDGEGPALSEEGLRTPGQFGGDVGDRAGAVPDDRGHRVLHELLTGQPVRRGQPARLQVHQIRRQDEPRLVPLVEGGRRREGPPSTRGRPGATLRPVPQRPRGGRVPRGLLDGEQRVGRGAGEGRPAAAGHPWRPLGGAVGPAVA